jgi:hypothetical protein
MTQTLHDKLKTNKLIVDPTTNPDNFYIVQPTPGTVIKFKKARLQFSHDEEQKCFLNIAHCIEIPPPENIENEVTFIVKCTVYFFKQVLLFFRLGRIGSFNES